MKSKEPIWRRRLAPLGIPIRFIADHPELLATACGAYAAWSVESSDAVGPELELGLELCAAPTVSVSAHIRVEGSRLTLTGAVSGSAEASTRRARCKVPQSWLSSPARLVDEALDPLLLFLLARVGRTPVHAAGIVLGNTALVLAGPSGTGKSTLALTAATQGLAVLSDDTVHIQCAPVFGVWGVPRPIHVFAADVPGGAYPVRQRGGKWKVAIPLRRPCPMPVARAALIVLQHGPAVTLAPLPPEEAVAACLPLEPGFDLLPDESRTALAALAAQGAWRLTLTQEPHAAITLLRRHFEA
jgi:hypothetical protein